MDLRWSSEQVELRATARAALERECSFERIKAATLAPHEMDEVTWSRVRTLGWPAMILPAPHGAGLGVEEAVLVALELGRSLCPVPLISTWLAGWAVAALASPGQAARLLPALADGSTVGALAGSARRADAEPELALAGPEGLRLDGHAGLVRAGRVSDLYVVPVKTAAGPRVAVVERSAGGVEVRPREAVGHQGAADVVFSDVHLDPAGVLDGEAGPDFASALQILVTLLQVAEAVGGGERLLEMTCDHARARHQFGRAIGSFQAVRHRAADMLNRLDEVRWLLFWTASGFAAGDDVSARASALQIKAISATREVLLSAQQIHGGVGFFHDHPIHLYFGQQKAFELGWGRREAYLDHLAGTVF